MSMKFAPDHVKVPEGMAELLQTLTREILRDQPADLVPYCAEYFNTRLLLRDGKLPPPRSGAARSQPSAKVQSASTRDERTTSPADTAANTEEIDIDLDDPDVKAAATKIQGAFRVSRQRKVEAEPQFERADAPPQGSPEQLTGETDEEVSGAASASDIAIDAEDAAEDQHVAPADDGNEEMGDDDVAMADDDAGYFVDGSIPAEDDTVRSEEEEQEQEEEEEDEEDEEERQEEEEEELEEDSMQDGDNEEVAAEATEGDGEYQLDADDNDGDVNDEDGSKMEEEEDDEDDDIDIPDTSGEPEEGQGEEETQDSPE